MNEIAQQGFALGLRTRWTVITVKDANDSPLRRSDRISGGLPLESS